MLKLQFQAIPNNWERFKLRKANPKFKKVAGMIMQRDDFTCQYTGYKGPGIEVVNKDGNYSNNVKSNLVTACSMAARCILLDNYNLDYSGPDKIIYLPEMTQAQLLNLIRILFCQMSMGDSEAAYNARMIMAQLQDRAQHLDDKLGVKLSHPGHFTYYLNQKDRDMALVNKLRWLPALESMQEAIPGWREALHL